MTPIAFTHPSTVTGYPCVLGKGVIAIKEMKQMTIRTTPRTRDRFHQGVSRVFRSFQIHFITSPIASFAHTIAWAVELS